MSRIPAGYKQTAVGVIPEEWGVKSFGELFAFGNGINADKDCYGRGFRFVNVLEPITYSHIYGPELTGRVAVSDAVATAYAVRFGDVLFNRTSETDSELGLATTYLGTERVLFGGFVIRGRPTGDSLDPKYAGYALRAQVIRSQIIPMGQGAVRANIGQRSLKLVVTPVPPLPEQRAIAEALSDADALIESLEQLVTKKRHLKQGAMRDLLTGRIRLPGFRDDWKLVRLDELGKWKGGMTPSMQNSSYWHGGTVPWISSGDVKSALLATTAYSITAAAIREGATTLLPANSIVVVTRSGILRKYLPVAMNMIPMAINQDIKALIPNDQIIPSYLLHTFIGHSDEILARCMKAGTTVESIEYTWMKAFTIPLPPLAEQAAITDALSDIVAESIELESQLAKARSIKRGMMNKLLTGRIRLI